MHVEGNETSHHKQAAHLVRYSFLDDRQNGVVVPHAHRQSRLRQVLRDKNVVTLLHFQNEETPAYLDACEKAFDVGKTIDYPQIQGQPQYAENLHLLAALHLHFDVLFRVYLHLQRLHLAFVCFDDIH